MTQLLVGALAAGAAVLAIGTLPLLANRGSRTPTIGCHPDRDVLTDAGWPFSLARWECLRFALVIATFGVAYALPITPLAVVAVGLAPSLAARVRAQTARDRARASLAQLLLDTHAALRSGIALPEALRRAAAGCPDRLARRPFELAIRRFDLGDALDDAIRDAVAGSADRRLIATFHTLALGVSERLPIERAAALLEAMAERAVHDERVDMDVRARTAGVRVQSYLLAAIVPALALYLVATMPGLGATLATPLGRTVLIPAAVALEVTGIAVNRRVVRGITR
jgi:Flp pilus assembly protein TadB